MMRVVSGTPVEGNPEWSAYTAPDGRKYYYHKESGKSAWEKPDELKTLRPAIDALYGA